MNPDIEDLLREGMVRFTADLRAPAGLTDRVRQRRRRRLVLRWSVGPALAAAAAVVALVAVGTSSAELNGTGGTAADAAYVVKRVDGALSAADPGTIAQMTITTSAKVIGAKTMTSTAEEWSYGDAWRAVTYSATGQPVYDEGANSSSVYTLVSYLTKTWARQSGLGRPAGALPTVGPGRCGAAATSLPLLFQEGLPSTESSASSLPATVARALRTAVSCGALTVAGRQRVDGIAAIELTSSKNSPISETIWVSPGSYLPVRVVVRNAPGSGVGPGLLVLSQTANISWLPATSQNLAKLTVAIPAGFRQVPLADALLPTLRQIQGQPSDAARSFGGNVSLKTTPCPANITRRLGVVCYQMSR